MKFYDRQKELETMRRNREQAEKSASFMVLYGRRRIGKTSLLLESVKGLEHAYLFVAKENEVILCERFQKVLEEQLGIVVYGRVTKFRDLFETVMKESLRRHFTLIIDEFQTLYRVNPTVFADIQDLWDRYHRDSRLNLIVSGSVRTLMKRIFEDKGEPLYGRPTSSLSLRPFTTSVLKQILGDYNPHYTSEDLLCLYMITGGVAKYVELLMDAGSVTKDKMLDHVCLPDSYFLTEGRTLLSQEFGEDSATYFSLLQLIAKGLTRRSELDSASGKDSGVYLQLLENQYYMINRRTPLLSKSNSKISSYEISDCFLRFWFRFVAPYQDLIEQQRLDLIREHIEKTYDTFSGRALEHYFHNKTLESGHYTKVGRWWDRKGTNEIDMIALKEFDHSGLVAEIKRNPQKISLPTLAEKIDSLPPAFNQYDLKLQALSMDDM